MRTVGWFVSAWLALAALQLVTSSTGSGRLSGLLGGATNVLDRVLDPGVPAIPDRRLTNGA